MNISLLISLFTFLLPVAQVPNYYRSYPTARAESSRNHMDMLIFFSSASCDNCNGAWTAFTKDAGAVNQYISTQVATDNFDGQILYEHFDPGSVPAWVILDASGKVKERWQGGWKDAYGKGTLYVQETPLAETKKAEVVTTPKSSTPSPSSTPNNSTTSTPSKSSPATTKPVQEPVVQATPEPVKKNETTIAPASSPTSGFVIQAGYFGSETNAQKCMADLKAKGFTQFSIKPLQQNGSTFYRVWSSSYATEKEAQSKLEQLSAAGIKGTVKSAS
jgi:cell division septation protein DedD